MSIKVTTDGIHLLANNDYITPIGSVICYAGQTTPPGWLFCNGADVLKTTYPNLYAVIGNMYGSPSNSNSDYFILPNLKEKIPMGNSGETNFQLGNKGGAKTVTLAENQLPSHSHTGTTVANGLHNHALTDPGHAHQYEDVFYSENINPGDNLIGSNATDGDNTFRFRPTQTTTTVNSNISLAESGTHTHTFTTNATGSGNSVNILNPYLVLNYLIKF